MGTPWDQMPDYAEAVRRERRAGDPTKYGASEAPPPQRILIDTSQNVRINAIALMMSRNSSLGMCTMIVDLISCFIDEALAKLNGHSTISRT